MQKLNRFEPGKKREMVLTGEKPSPQNTYSACGPENDPNNLANSHETVGPPSKEPDYMGECVCVCVCVCMCVCD